MTRKFSQWDSNPCTAGSAVCATGAFMGCIGYQLEETPGSEPTGSLGWPESGEASINDPRWSQNDTKRQLKKVWCFCHLYLLSLFLSWSALNPWLGWELLQCFWSALIS